MKTFILFTRKYEQVPAQLGFATGESIEHVASKLGLTITTCRGDDAMYSSYVQLDREYVYFREVPELKGLPDLSQAIRKALCHQV